MSPGGAFRKTACLLCGFAGAASFALPARSATGVRAVPILQEPSSRPVFIGSPAVPHPVRVPLPPQHPFMAPDGRNNLHEDAYMTDAHRGLGPLGKDMEQLSTLLEGVCASIVFDSAGRVISVCVGLEAPKLVMLDPRTLDLLAFYPLPPRIPGSVNIFTDFAGGGYFYLDNADRVVVGTTTGHLLILAEQEGPTGWSFSQERDYDLTGLLAPGDKIVSAIPSWSGRIWFITVQGMVGVLDPATGAAKAHQLDAGIANSFSVDETGGIYVVSDKALYRFDLGPDGAPKVTWSEVYENIGIKKPGQGSPGSGTTPTLMGSEYVSITDNADPMNVVVYRRGKTVAGSRLVCKQPVFQKGASDTDQSLIAAGNAMIVENNYGYSGPVATMNGGVTSPGLERVDINPDGKGCHTVWKSAERAPSVVPKLSLANGLVYTYTKDPQDDGADVWYLTAIDFQTGKT
ncbi:MAG: hypothetical protein WDA71_12285, partial [Actinomycetota bacterium]